MNASTRQPNSMLAASDPLFTGHAACPSIALGGWSLLVDTPIGTKATSLGLEQTPDGLGGWMIDLFGQRIPATQVKVDGNQVAWRIDIAMPVTLAIHFTATVTGHQMSGVADARVVTMPFAGSRQDVLP